MRRVAGLHRLLVVTAAEDGRYEDVLKSLRAMQTVAGHAADQPGLLGALVAQSVDVSTHAAIVRVATYFSDDEKGLALLTEFVASMKETPFMTGLRREVPLTLAVIDQLASGEVKLSDVLGESSGQGAAGTSVDKLLPFADYHDSMRERYLRIMVGYADVWGDHAAVVKVEEALDAELEEDTEDLATILSNMVMAVLLPMTSSTHYGELSARVRARMTKIGLAAMEYRRANGAWPTLEVAAQTAEVDPADPFGDRIHYLPSGDSLTMYSNGRDMADNGGRRREGPDSQYDSPIVTFRFDG